MALSLIHWAAQGLLLLVPYAPAVAPGRFSGARQGWRRGVMAEQHLGPRQTGILLSLKKENSDACYNVDELGGHCAQ